MIVTQSCPTLCDPMDCTQAPLSMGFSRQEYWSGLPFPSPTEREVPHLRGRGKETVGKNKRQKVRRKPRSIMEKRSQKGGSSVPGQSG